MGGSPGHDVSSKKAYRELENSMLSYNELVNMGRIKEGQRYAGLSGDQSRFSRALGGYQDALAASNPAFAKYRALMEQGMAGLETGGIPNDFRRSITENIRQAQASRGILDSDTAAIEEAVRLMGGQEAIRGQRINEINQYFGNILGPGINASMPSLGMELGIQNQNNQMDMQNYQNKIGIFSDIAGGAIMAGGMAMGGPAAPMMMAGAGMMQGTAGAQSDPWASGPSYPQQKYGGGVY